MTQRPKVLMIDDNKEICRLMKEYLEKSGRYEVTVFTDARMGVRYAQIEKPDVILMDLMMPDMDGTEAAEYLLDDEATRNDPHHLHHGCDQEGRGGRSPRPDSRPPHPGKARHPHRSHERDRKGV